MHGLTGFSPKIGSMCISPWKIGKTIRVCRRVLLAILEKGSGLLYQNLLLRILHAFCCIAYCFIGYLYFVTPDLFLTILH